MKFFHVYNDHHIKGLEKNGFINKETGFKIQHDFPIPPEIKFNEFASKGTPLYNLIKDIRAELLYEIAFTLPNV